MSIKLLVAFCFFGLVTCDTYPSCGGKGTLNNVIIEGCTPDQKCILKRGTSKNIEIDFTPSTGSSTLEMDVYGVIAGIPFAFPGFDKDGCQAKYNIQCPLVANTQYQYKNQLNIASSYPAIDVTVKWEGNDDNDDLIFCFLVDAEVQSSDD